MCPAWGNQPSVFSLTFLVRTTWPSDNHSAYCLCASVWRSSHCHGNKSSLFFSTSLCYDIIFAIWTLFLARKGNVGFSCFEHPKAILGDSSVHCRNALNMAQRLRASSLLFRVIQIRHICISPFALEKWKVSAYFFQSFPFSSTLNGWETAFWERQY